MAQRKTANGILVKPATLDEMWSPQFPNPGGRVFGLGFVVGALDGHRWWDMVARFMASQRRLDVLPDDKLGVVVIATKDAANAVTDRIAREALRLVLAQRAGKPCQPSSTDYRGLARLWSTNSQDAMARAMRPSILPISNGRLSMLPVDGGEQKDAAASRQDFDCRRDSWVTDRRSRRLATEFEVRLTEPSARAIRRMPADFPEKWNGLIGEYGWDHDILYVFEKEGRLSF